LPRVSDANRYNRRLRILDAAIEWVARLPVHLGKLDTSGERLVGSIRRECIEHMVVFSEAQLRRDPQRAYASYYRAIIMTCGLAFLWASTSRPFESLSASGKSPRCRCSEARIINRLRSNFQ